MTLDNLSYRAYRDNQDLILSGTYNHTGHVDERPMLQRDTIRAVSKRRRSERYRCRSQRHRRHRAGDRDSSEDSWLPEGWEPTGCPSRFIFARAVYCKGGTAELRVGDARYSYTFHVPHCSIGGAEMNTDHA